MGRREFWVMFLRHKICRKDGKEHRTWSVVENRRVHDGRVVQRQVLYLGEINDSQQAAWSRAIEVFDEDAEHPTQIALFPEDRVGAGSRLRCGVDPVERDAACAVRANGAPAGWPWPVGSTWAWTSSGARRCRPRARARAG